MTLKRPLKILLFFDGTMDLQIIKNFGVLDNNYCIVDTHGVVKLPSLERLMHAFDAFIIHVSEDELQETKSIAEFVSKAQNYSLIFVFVRDCKRVIRRVDCVNQQLNRNV